MGPVGVLGDFAFNVDYIPGSPHSNGTEENQYSELTTGGGEHAQLGHTSPNVLFILSVSHLPVQDMLDILERYLHSIEKIVAIREAAERMVQMSP